MPNLPSAPAQRLTLWFSKVSEATATAEQAVADYLSPSEEKRLQRIRPVKKRREYLLSRSLMRHALGETFGGPATDWCLHEQQDASPLPRQLPDGTHLSLSHSGGYICFAVASCPVGVDIEVIRTDRDYLASASFFMDEVEQAQLLAARDSQVDFFYRSWCAKEAWYKALTPTLQAQTVMRSIHYQKVRTGCDGRRLLEGHGSGFRLATVVVAGTLRFEQAHYLEPVQVTLEDS